MITSGSERGFTLLELLMSTALSLIVIGTALTAFKDSIGLNEIAVQVTDATQNLRSGANLLVSDLMQAGRGIPTGGISIPSGVGADPLIRPGPPGSPYFFDDTDATTLTAVTTGDALGPSVNGTPTDIVTLLMVDWILDEHLGQPLQVNPSTTPGLVPKLAGDGSSFSVGTSTGWIGGDPLDAQAPVRAGELLLFTSPSGSTAIQTVTAVDASNVYFEADDPFNFNQRTVAAGSITQILGAVLTVQRVLMYTYFVDTSIAGAPRLMRKLNHFGEQALPGIVETLDLSYDLVDGAANPAGVADLPYTDAGVTYSANLVRRANIDIGVRSEAMSTWRGDYFRSRLSTVVSLRNLAFVDRYR